MYFTIWIFVCFLLSISCGKIDETIGQFIVDFTKNNFYSFFVTAFVCSSPDDLLKVSKQLSAQQIAHNFTNINNIKDDIMHYDPCQSHHHLFILDYDCPNADNILIMANASKMFVAPRRWLIFQKLNYTNHFPENNFITEQNTKQFQSTLERMAIFPDSEVYIGQVFDSHSITIMSVYRPNFDKGLILKINGNWNESMGLQTIESSRDIPLSRSRQDLQNITLKTCLVITNPRSLNHLTDFAEKKIDVVSKLSYSAVLLVVDRLNARVNYTWNDTWGYQNEEGAWSGMIGLLDREEIDFGGTATWLVPQRLGVVDYFHLYTPVTFVFRKPPLSYVKNLFTLPFEPLVWCTIGVFLCFFAGVLFVIMKWEWQQINKPWTIQKPRYQLEETPTLSDNLLILIGSVFQQGFFYEARYLSPRILIFILLLSSLSLYTSYTANIVALLQSSSSSIKTIQDLTDSGLGIGIYDIVYNRYYFTTMIHDSIRQRFFQRFIENQTSVWMSLEKGVDNIRKGLFAFHCDTTLAYLLMQETYEEDEKCGLDVIDYLKLVHPMQILRRNSPYREMFRVGGLWIRETGLQQRLLNRLFTKKPPCEGQTSFVSVGIRDCYAALLVMAYGIFITIGLLFTEIIYYKCFDHYSSTEEHIDDAISENNDDEIIDKE